MDRHNPMPPPAPGKTGPHSFLVTWMRSPSTALVIQRLSCGLHGAGTVLAEVNRLRLATVQPLVILNFIEATREGCISILLKFILHALVLSAFQPAEISSRMVAYGNYAGTSAICLGGDRKYAWQQFPRNCCHTIS
jgi:hypothetical protein